jgi:hypothetical protein
MTNTRRVKKTKTVATVAIGATRPNFQGPPQNATLASSLLFDMRDVLLFVVIVAIIASIVYGTGLLMGDKDAPMMVVVVPDKNKPPSQTTNNENIGAEIPVASIVFISLLLCFVAYLVATGKSSKVKRLAPSLGVASFFVGVGSFIRFYPSNWSHAASSGCVIVGYSLAVFLTIKEFSILPWDREKKKIENKKKKEKIKSWYASIEELKSIVKKMKKKLEPTNEKMKKLDNTEKDLEVIKGYIDQIKEGTLTAEQERFVIESLGMARTATDEQNS